MLVQLRFPTGLSSEQYVTEEAWKDARLDRCPAHPEGGCGFARHGTYPRKHPQGARITRYYCRPAHQTFSLLPDCLASRFSATLVEVEEVVAERERTTVQGAAELLRPCDVESPIGLDSAVRWVLRRSVPVRFSLNALIQLKLLTGCEPTISSVRSALNQNPVLAHLRRIGAGHLADLPPPIGFGPKRRRHQHETGPDPPADFS